MHKITNSVNLKSTIQQLELKQANEWPLLKEQFLDTCESLKPLNVIKSTFKEFTSAPDFKGNLLAATVVLTGSLVTQALFTGALHNPIKRLFGSLFQLGVSGLVSKNIGAAKLLSENIIGFLRKKKKNKNES